MIVLIMLIFALRLIGRKGSEDDIEKIKNNCKTLLSEWDMANIIRILKTRNQTLYKKFNSLYDEAVEIT